ncbi:MAG: hypothetical protein ACFFCD_16940 [Promethearchaeota archaeon]
MIQDFICKDCKHYKPIDEVKGKCFEHEVLANMPTELCPVQGFELAQKIPLKSHVVFEMVGDLRTKTVLETHMKKTRDDWPFK